LPTRSWHRPDPDNSYRHSSDWGTSQKDHLEKRRFGSLNRTDCDCILWDRLPAKANTLIGQYVLTWVAVHHWTNEEHFYVWIRTSQFKVHFSPCLLECFEHVNYWYHFWCHRWQSSIQPTHHARCWCKRIACRWSLKMEAAKFHRVVSEETRSNSNRPTSKAWRSHRFPIWAARMKSSQSFRTIKTPWSGWQSPP